MFGIREGLRDLWGDRKRFALESAVALVLDAVAAWIVATATALPTIQVLAAAVAILLSFFLLRLRSYITEGKERTNEAARDADRVKRADELRAVAVAVRNEHDKGKVLLDAWPQGGSQHGAHGSVELTEARRAWETKAGEWSMGVDERLGRNRHVAAYITRRIPIEDPNCAHAPINRKVEALRAAYDAVMIELQGLTRL